MGYDDWIYIWMEKGHFKSGITQRTMNQKTYECQGIQTKSPFDEILSLNLGPLKLNNNASNKSQFCKGLSRGFVIKHIWWKKFQEDKNLLTKLKKTLIP